MMAPFIGEQEQGETIGSGVIRRVIKETFGGEKYKGGFHIFVDGVIGDLLGISRFLFLSILFWGMYLAMTNQVPNLPLFTLEWLIGLAPVWLPIALLVGAWKIWVWYVQALFLHKV